ncbi:MAG: hypothetical protein HY078_01550 [Elusimicrobia bacterium]|nr:hypothetical protein [Elusimicrobiota bacterium]
MKRWFAAAALVVLASTGSFALDAERKGADALARIDGAISAAASVNVRGEGGGIGAMLQSLDGGLVPAVEVGAPSGVIHQAAASYEGQRPVKKACNPRFTNCSGGGQTSTGRSDPS